MPLKLEVVPEKAVVIRRGPAIVAAIWFGPWVRAPYVYPFLGPRGRELTRLGHPGDPVGHSHHRSIWVAHHDVGGVDFWGDSTRSGRIVVRRVRGLRESGPEVEVVLECSWQDPGGAELLAEERHLGFIDLPGEELAMELTLRLQASGRPVTLGATPFGFLGIRVATTLRVHEGLGGLIVNSEEGENEAGCFGQHALWCDMSGPVVLAGTPGEETRGPSREAPVPAAIAGIACFDHPRNSREGTLWHVRDDGWMGPSVTREAARSLEAGHPLELRYRVEGHAGRPWTAGIAERYRAWAARRG